VCSVSLLVPSSHVFFVTVAQRHRKARKKGSSFAFIHPLYCSADAAYTHLLLLICLSSMAPSGKVAAVAALLCLLQAASGSRIADVIASDAATAAAAGLKQQHDPPPAGPLPVVMWHGGWPGLSLDMSLLSLALITLPCCLDTSMHSCCWQMQIAACPCYCSVSACRHGRQLLQPGQHRLCCESNRG
jgi:hypothetical protein